ncbi:MAG: hypothetical protein ACK2T7_14085 [Anaerolineales bacterium]
MKTSPPERSDYIRSIVYILIYVTVIGVGAFLLLPDLWYLWMLIVIAGVVILVSWHRGATAYICPHCGHTFELSFWKDLLAPHGVDKDGGWLYLKCPECGERSKMQVLKREE